MIDDVILQRALDETGFGSADRVPLAGDASRRRYERLGASGKSAILMISPPEIDPSLPRFLYLSELLRKGGVSAPDVYFADTAAGIAILEDIGPVLRESPDLSDVETGLGEAVRLIPEYGRFAADVPYPSTEELLSAMELAKDWLPSADPVAFDDFSVSMRPYLEQLCESPRALSLRDYHAGNLTWLAHRNGTARIGVLDFQDAFMVHPTYDLASILYDARVDYPDELQAKCIADFAQITKSTPEEVALSTSIITLQRNVRILGIFARLALRDGKSNYLRFIQHTAGTLRRAVEHPELEDLASLLRSAIGDVSSNLRAFRP